MNVFPIPSFIPVPSAGVMLILSIISIIIGICLLIVGLVLYKKNKKIQKKSIASTVCIIIGALLIANHGIQLLFRIF